MITINEEEEIIRLVHNGFDLELLCFELDIPIENLEKFKERLELREFAKASVKGDSNIRKKNEQKDKKNLVQEDTKGEIEEFEKTNYEEIIKRYKKEIAADSQKSLGKRNLLAFAYFRAGRIDESREELTRIIQETSSFIAYRQLIHLEKTEGNFEDAKLWAYEAIDKFPDRIEIREQLISIARIESDNQEIIRQLKDIISIKPENEKNRKRLNKIVDKEEK